MRRLPPFLAALAILATCLLPAAPALAAKDIDYHRLPQKKLLARAADGDLEAIWHLQLSSYFDYKNKQTVTRTLDERLPWMRKGAELGDYRLQFNLAQHLLQPPPGTAPDPVAAEPLLVAGLAGAQQLEGRSFLAGQLLREGPTMLARARQLQKVPTLLADGSPAALFEAAQAFVPLKFASWPEQPLGDAAEHRRLVELAARQGHVEAIVQMANGSLTREDALMWRLLAAERGHVPSMEGMAAEFAGRDKAASWDWHRRAAEAGSSNSATWYALHLQEKGDKAGAIVWLEKAAAAGHKGAQEQLSTLVDPYVVRLTEAAGRGDGAAALELGDYYRKKGDKSRARGWYSRASELKNIEGTYQLALHSDAPGSQRHYMTQAAEGGHPGAKAWLANDAQRGQRALQQAAQQMEAEKRQAFVARIDRDGSTDKLEVEYYCQYGGRRCNELRGLAHRAEQGRNAQVQSDNMRRIQEVHSGNNANSDAAARARSECMRRKTESIQRSTYGQQDWKFEGGC